MLTLYFSAAFGSGTFWGTPQNVPEPKADEKEHFSTDFWPKVGGQNWSKIGPAKISATIFSAIHGATKINPKTDPEHIQTDPRDQNAVT